MNSLVLERDILISLHVVHIDALHFLLAFRVERETVPSNVRKEESTTEVKRILQGLGEFVVNSVDSDPIVYRALKIRKIFRLRIL